MKPTSQLHTSRTYSFQLYLKKLFNSASRALTVVKKIPKIGYMPCIVMMERAHKTLHKPNEFKSRSPIHI